jgi:uncharacterized protein
MVVASPCTKICVLDKATGWCTGCRRSADEIARWPAMTDAERRSLLGAIAQRPVPAGRTSEDPAGRNEGRA